jgi:hypothetical protein
MPPGGTQPDVLAAAFGFRLSYEHKVLLDTIDAGRRVLQPAPGCHFVADD